MIIIIIIIINNNNNNNNNNNQKQQKGGKNFAIHISPKLKIYQDFRQTNNLHISPHKVLDYPTKLSPYASDRSITLSYFVPHLLSPRIN